MAINQYIIKMDGKYFAGEDVNKVVGETANWNSWYVIGRDLHGLAFTPDRDKAKIIEGKTNLKSYFNKIHEHLRQKLIDFESLVIEKVGEV